MRSFAVHIRTATGLVCLASAVLLFVFEVPRAVRDLNDQRKTFSYIKNDRDRLLTTGDIQGVPRALQLAALRVIPAGTDYAVLMPATVAAAAPYGINAVAMVDAPAFLRYLLLPRWQVGDASRATYVICFGCDTDPWDHRTDWLWRDGRGDAIGRVRST